MRIGLKVKSWSIDTSAMLQYRPGLGYVVEQMSAAVRAMENPPVTLIGNKDRTDTESP